MNETRFGTAELTARVDALRYEFSFPGEDLLEFENGLRHRARTRQITITVTTGLILFATLFIRPAPSSWVHAVFYACLVGFYAWGTRQCRREVAGAREIEWLRHRLRESAPRRTSASVPGPTQSGRPV